MKKYAMMPVGGAARRRAFWLLTLLLLLPGLRPVAVQAAEPPAASAEGMWIPLLVSQNFEQMRQQGLRLRPEQIYSANQSSLKDAIVWFGGFCTGEIISPEGLILTNHHCGYDAIQTLSTVEQNHLQNGFWAKSKSEELPAKGLFVKFLVRIEDMTQRVLAETANLEGAERDSKIQQNARKVVEEARKGNNYDVQLKSMYYGGEYYLYVYETYNDVRLVGTPHESIGKFGGDTDNWMWPRHTGDFSMFRVYAGPDGKPADYSPNNVPLKPKHYLPVSNKGVEKNDYAMIMGFPGRTERYLTSDILSLRYEQSSPARIKLRNIRLETWKEFMDVDPKVRLQYASKYARIANYWKYFIGQNRGLRRLRTIDFKKEEEAKFMKWVGQNPQRQQKYGSVIENVRKASDDYRNFVLSITYFNECMIAPEIVAFAMKFRALQGELEKTEPSKDEIDRLTADLRKQAEAHFKDYHMAADRKATALLYSQAYKDLPRGQLPSFLLDVEKKHKGDFFKFADELFAKSMFASQSRVDAFLSKPDLKALKKDPVNNVLNSIITNYYTHIQPQSAAFESAVESNLRVYIQGLREMQADRMFYPDANSTMRVTYGQVKDYAPADAVHYDFYTTADGIYDKENPDDPEFVVPKELIELIRKKDYGRWARKDGKMPVCFLSTTDITGGNSGSPVINGEGELIGLAFDGNWEAMTGDLVYDPELKRTINVDVRYILFIIDKLAGASNLIQEMKIVEAK